MPFQSRPPRPLGVTILALLSIIGANFSFLTAFVLIVFSPLVSLFLVGNGILSFVVGIGYLDGNGWAWTFGVVSSLISVILLTAGISIGSLPSAGIFGIVVAIVELFYLTRPTVLVFFGRRAYNPVPEARSASTSFDRLCGNCGKTIPAGATFCRNCGVAP